MSQYVNIFNIFHMKICIHKRRTHMVDIVCNVLVCAIQGILYGI